MSNYFALMADILYKPPWNEQWKYLPQNLDANLDQVNWEFISRRWRISLEFAEKYQDYLNWDWVSTNRPPEDLVLKFFDRINWNEYFCAGHLVSEKIINLCLDNLDPNEYHYCIANILNNRVISPELAERIISYQDCNVFYISINNSQLNCPWLDNQSISDDLKIKHLNIFSHKDLQDYYKFNKQALSSRLREAIEMYLLLSG